MDRTYAPSHLPYEGRGSWKPLSYEERGWGEVIKGVTQFLARN
jgi:hypothetical protein